MENALQSKNIVQGGSSVQANSVAITLENFQQVMIEESKTKLVLVDFWVAQLPESVELKDKLTEKLAAVGEHILLATVDCEAQQQVAQQFGVQNLPTAVIVQDGQPIDGISGPQTDEAIDEFLAKHLPAQQDLLLAQAKALLAENKLAEAQTAINQAFQLDSERADIKLVLADVLIQNSHISEAETLMASITLVDQNSDYLALKAKLELANQAANSPELQALEQQVVTSPDNILLKHQLAAQYSQVQRFEDALNILFALVQNPKGCDDGGAKSKELMLDVLKALPDGDPLANKFRRKLYTLMY